MVNAGLMNSTTNWDSIGEIDEDIVIEHYSNNDDMEIEEDNDHYATQDDDIANTEYLTPPRLERQTNINYINIITPIPNVRQNERFVNMNAPYTQENVRRNLMNYY
jgi:hypothetical protein